MIEYLTRINWVDILILILLLRTSYIGFTRGLSYETLTIIGIIGATVVAIHNYRYTSRFFITHLNLPIDFSNLLSFLILAIGTFILCRYIKILFYKFVKLEVFPALEKYGGLIFGFMRGCVFSSLVLLCLLLVPNDYIRNSIQHRSLAGMVFLKIAPACYEYSISLFPRFRQTKRSKIVEEILTHEPSEGKVKSHIKRQIKR